jgi:aspartate/tyrosine/aromatic aminotransferase
MDFTESHKQTLGLVAFSPGGSYIMNTATNRLIIRRVDTFQISRTCVIDDASPTVKTLMAANLSAKSNSEQDLWISHASWSADAELFMAACAKGGRIVVYKMRDESWNASINVGAEGLLRAEFAPDARSVLCFSQWGVSVTFKCFHFCARRIS